jgi:ATP-dependent DNA helicase RecG
MARTTNPQRVFDFDVKPKLELLMSPDEILERADESFIPRCSEDHRIERKSTSYSGDKLGDYVCMWANTSPDGGLIAYGVLDDGTIEGCKHLSQEQLNRLEKVGYTYCPDANVEIRRISVHNKKGDEDFVVLFRVEYRRDIVVRTTSGKVFVRRGDSKCELRADEIRELQADKGEISFEQRDCGLQWPDDFDEKSASTFAAVVKEKRGLAESLTVPEVLSARRLGRGVGGEFRPNYACLLLFANDPIRSIPGCKVHFQRFEGEHEGTGEKYNAVKDVILEGCVPGLIRQAEETLDSQLRTFSPLDAKGKFYPVPEYPKQAWYEAVVNACVHRSYGNGMKNMPIFVKMFDDRLVVESPGSFPPFVTPKNIYDPFIQHPRNPQLMDAMFYLEYVKAAHEGVRRMRDTMVAMKLPIPEFSEKQSEVGNALVRVILRNNIKQRRAWIDRDVSKIVSEAIASDLSEDERQAVNWVAERGKITITDASQMLKLTWSSARKLLLGLVQKKVFQYIRFVPYVRNTRDSKAHFRLRSNAPLPEGAFDQIVIEPKSEPKPIRSKSKPGK